MEEMREIRAAAEAYYKNCERNIIESAEKFFRDLDNNGDGRVSVAEFMYCLSDKNSYNPHMRNKDFFRKLDQDGDGELDFNEVCTLFYIIVSKRQFCEGCGDFLKGLFFTCVKCYDDSKQYNLCPSCFGGKKYIHDHKNIIDNYLLHTQRMGSRSRPEPAPNSHQVTVAAQTNNLQLVCRDRDKLIHIKETISLRSFDFLRQHVALESWGLLVVDVAFCNVVRPRSIDFHY